MSFEPPFKERLRSECIASASAEEKAMLTNLHEDYRIPSKRALDFASYSLGSQGKVVDHLADYTRKRIRATRRLGGFVSADNDLNKLGLTKPLRKKPSHFEYGRILELTNLFLFRSLEKGIEYAVQKAHRADASDFGPLADKKITKRSESERFASYCSFVRSSVSMPRDEAREFLQPWFNAYHGYIDAIDDVAKVNFRIDPYEPAWVTSWETFEGWDLDNTAADDWCKTLGVQYNYSDPEPAVWVLLKYRLPPGYDLYRPTCLEAGRYPLHFPTHCGIEGPFPAMSGRTMDCREPKLTKAPEEWIHLNCRLKAEDVIKLAFIRTPFPDSPTHLLGWRERHHNLLTTVYPYVNIPMAQFLT